MKICVGKDSSETAHTSFLEPREFAYCRLLNIVDKVRPL